MTSPAQLQAEVDALGWYHSIDLGNGVRTRGVSTNVVREDQLPELHGKSVLDIGAWDGYYSFLAERLGARRVVAMDHYAWGVNIAARDRYWEECRAKGILADQTRDYTAFWSDDLPGRRGFDLARKALGSKVEPVVLDFASSDLTGLGQFDVVLFLGVLYHMKEPLAALERVRALTTGVAVIETVAMDVPEHSDVSLVRFLFSGDYGAGVDFGNWYVPNVTALKGLCQAAGFSRVEVIQGLSRRFTSTGPSLRQRFNYAIRGEHLRIVGDYRAIVHAFV